MSTGHATAAQTELTWDDETDVVTAQESKPDNSYVDEPGTYHFLISKMRALIGNEDGAEPYGFEVQLTVIATEPGHESQMERVHWEKFNFGAESHADKGVFCNSRIRTFMQACGKVDPTLRGSFTLLFTIDEYQDFQLISTIKEARARKGAKATDRKFYEIDGLSMWHVDDPEVATIPKHLEYLSFAPATMVRWDANTVKYVVDKRNAARAAAANKKPGHGGHGGAKPLPTPAKPVLNAAEQDTL